MEISIKDATKMLINAIEKGYKVETTNEGVETIVYIKEDQGIAYTLHMFPDGQVELIKE